MACARLLRSSTKPTEVRSGETLSFQVVGRLSCPDGNDVGSYLPEGTSALHFALARYVEPESRNAPEGPTASPGPIVLSTWAVVPFDPERHDRLDGAVSATIPRTLESGTYQIVLEEDPGIMSGPFEVGS